MEGRDYEDLSSMNVAMTQVGEELNEEMDNWCENRKGWVNDRVKDCIAERKSENRKYRYMRKTCRVDDVTHIVSVHCENRKTEGDIYEKERRCKTGSGYGFTCT